MIKNLTLAPEYAEVAEIDDEESEKEQRIVEYIRSLKTIEDAMEPYKEQKRDLRKEFKDQGWLDAEEQRMVTKAYRLVKDETDLEQLMDFYETIKKARNGKV
tara:strand:- start:838 stop:1143 length:306 start_codon:yes stop_codon:yes gene_type:complete